MGILPQPIEERFLAFAAGGVAHRTAVSVEIFQAQLRAGERVRQGRAVPAPLRLRAQRQLFVRLREAICSPVTSAVNANSPLPTESGLRGSSAVSDGLCRRTRLRRSIAPSAERAGGAN